MKKLNWIEITALYIGSIMGAGFASGRECWQFFCVFGGKGYIEVAVVTIGFILFSCMMTYIAIHKNTSDLGRLVSPFNNIIIDNIPGIILASFFFMDVIVMTAAGGSLLNQQFGISKVYGGLIIAILIVITVLGDFERISSVFRYLIPVLFAAAVIMIILIIRADYSQSGKVSFEPGDMTPNWVVSAIVFLSYNTLAMPAIAGNSALNAKNSRNAYIGAITGSLLLGGLIIALMRALMTDLAFTAAMDLPLLAYSMRISPILNVLYALILFGSIYSTGSSLYFSFTTKLPNNNWKKYVVVTGAIIGFILGLSGFTTLVEYLYPMQGYIGIAILIMIVINFLYEFQKNIKRSHK